MFITLLRRLGVLIMTGFYKNATICLNGHVASETEANYRKFCKSCGEPTISNCQSCDDLIQGYYYVPGVFSSAKYNAPNYCHSCGKPYPWTEKLLNNAVELISLDDQLNDEQKQIIKNAIPDLIVESPTTALAQAKYKKYISNSAFYIQDGLKNLLVDVVSESVKKSLFG